MKTTVAAVAFLVSVSACSRPSYRGELFVPRDAAQVQALKDYDGGVKYQVLRVYPPDPFLSELNEYFASRGFQPTLIDDYGEEHRREWFEFTDGRRTPNTHVAQWLGYWQAANGDRILTALRYVTPLDKPVESTATLDVSSVYMSAATVERFKKAIADQKARKQPG